MKKLKVNVGDLVYIYTFKKPFTYVKANKGIYHLVAHPGDGKYYSVPEYAIVKVIKRPFQTGGNL